MTYEIKVYSALCSCEVFKVNGIDADSDDFGNGYDAGADYAEDYCCGNRVFEVIKPTKKVLEKYKITEEEYRVIGDELTEKLSWGSCGWCS
jgi:hypothetical protein